MSVLATESLSLVLGGRAALADVTVQFAPGRVTALLGPNGAGKSTLLACLAALRRPDSGHARLDGINVMQLPRQQRARQIGLLPQNAEVHWDIDVATLVALGRLPHHGRRGESAADRLAIARAMLATDVGQLAARCATQLSGGERGRALLARVLAGEPQWLLADEPLAGLDPAHQLDVLDRLREVAAHGAGVVLVLHDLTHAAHVAHDVVLLRDGHIVAQGARENVLTAPLLHATFDIDVHIGESAGGQFIVPLRRSR